MKVLCNRSTKRIEGFSQCNNIAHDIATQVVLTINYTPDITTERLNISEDGLRAATQIELDAEVAADLDIEGDIELSFSSTQKAFALVVLDEINLLRANAGLSTRTLTQLKSAVKSKL